MPRADKQIKPLEMRTYSTALEKREAEGNRVTVSGQPVVIGVRTDLGWFDEIIEQGALDETNLNDVRFCLNHDTSYVYARSRRNNPNSTMRLSVDPRGLFSEADLDTSIPAHQDLAGMIEREDIDKMSFMFSIDADEWEDLETDHPTRHITKIGTIVEISAVTFPAYEATSIEINERSREALEKARQELESAREQRNNTPEGANNNQLELEKAKLNLLRRTAK